MKTLKLASSLDLPLAAVTESIAVLAKRRAGKSTTARRLAEQLHRAGQQVVVADPKGDWWGLRFARDGKSPGLPFIVLGGEHGDVDLEATGGELVARLVVEQRASVILDLSRFRKGEVCRFMTAFMETLYRLKAQEKHRTPVMLIIDEADAIAPQKPFGDEARMVGAASDLVRRGGQRGIGVTMLTQRSAVLNKDLLTQIGILVVLQTIAPQDRKAIDAWIDVHGTPEQRAALMDSLPTLVPGEGWVWAPGWPSGAGIFQRQRFLLPETFDSSKTPESGGKAFEPKNAAPVDLDAFRADMAATIEKAKADDPKLLRAELAKVRAELETERRRKGQGQDAQKTQSVEVLTDADRALLGSVAARLGALPTELEGHLADFVKAAADLLAGALGKVMDGTIQKHEAAVARSRAEFVGLLEKRGLARILEKLARVSAPTQVALHGASATATVTMTSHRPGMSVGVHTMRAKGHATPTEGVSRPQQAILNALAWGESMRLPTQRREKVAFLADASPRSSAFMNNLGTLRSGGLIDYPQQGYVSLTDAGRKVAQVDDTAPTTSRELQDAICAKLPAPQGRIVRAVVAVYPKALERPQVADAAEASVTSSAFMNNLGALRSLGLIDYPGQGLVVASPVLFLEGR